MDGKNIKSVHLADEIIEEILSRLPVKSLLRFRCVSKSWLLLISSQRFVETHLQNSIKNRAFSRQRVILICYFKQGLHQCSVQQLLNEPSSIKPCRIDHPSSNQRLSEAKVVGCCNGLICLKKGLDFYLWNPATTIIVELPKLELDDTGRAKVGFGWDVKTGAYKVFVVMIHWPGIAKAYVYSSNTNSWKIMEEQGSHFLKDFMDDHEAIVVFACGRIYLLKDRGGFFINSLDLESEEFGRIEQPFIPPPLEDVYGRYYKLAEIGGCLHLLLVHVHGDDDGDDDSGGGADDYDDRQLFVHGDDDSDDDGCYYDDSNDDGCYDDDCDDDDDDDDSDDRDDDADREDDADADRDNDADRDDDQKSYAVVWVMKDTGWLKLFTVPLSSDDILPPLFGGGPNGEIFVIFHDIYFLYFPKDGQVVRERKNITGFFHGNVYVESLVSPNVTIAR